MDDTTTETSADAPQVPEPASEEEATAVVPAAEDAPAEHTRLWWVWPAILTPIVILIVLVIAWAVDTTSGGVARNVTLAGEDITQSPTPQIAARGVAYVPENMGIFADLTVKENMLLAARSAKHAGQMDEKRLQWIFSLFPAVEKFWNHPAGKLSGGQKQMLAVSRAIVEPRELLIIDEPSKGLAPAIINNMIDAFAQLKASGVTILLVEQNINFAKRLGDTVAVMDNGRVVHAGSMAQLAEDDALQTRLLGLSLGSHQ